MDDDETVRGHLIEALLALKVNDLDGPRAHAEAALNARAVPAVADAPWPGWSLNELLQRISAKTPLGHAPQIAGLQT